MDALLHCTIMGQRDDKSKHPQALPASPAQASGTPEPRQRQALRKEIGGPAGLEPTRYGDWERNGRCSDF